MKMSNDESLFAWQHKLDMNTGLLAPTPASFEDSGHYVSVNPQYIPRPPFSMTNKGLQIELVFVGDNPNLNIISAPLNCGHENHRSELIALSLKEQDGRIEELQRLPGQLEYCPKCRLRDPVLKSKTAYIKQHELSPGKDTKSFFVASLYPHGFEFKKTFVSNSSRGDYVKISKIQELLLFRGNSAPIELANESESFVLELRVDGEGQGFLHLLHHKNLSRGRHHYLRSRRADRILDRRALTQECAPPVQFSGQVSQIMALLFDRGGGGHLIVNMSEEDDYVVQIRVVTRS